MPTPVYGSQSFTNTPDVNGTLVMLNGGGNELLSSGLYSAIPAPGNTGNLYVATDRNITYRDTGSSWVPLTEVLNVYRTTPIITTTTTTLALSNALPPITSGIQIASLTVTPLSTTSIFRLQVGGTFDSSNTNSVITQMIFQGNTCIGTGSATISATGRLQTISQSIYVVPGTTSSTTFSVRVAGTVGTTFINRSSAAATLFGSTAGSDFLAMELAS